jgi:hypothetical protein
MRTIIFLLLILVIGSACATQINVITLPWSQYGTEYDPLVMPKWRAVATGTQTTWLGESIEPAPFALPYPCIAHRENTTAIPIITRIDFQQNYLTEGHLWNTAVKAEYWNWFSNCGMPLGIKAPRLGTNSPQFSYCSGAPLTISIHRTYTLQPGESLDIYLVFRANRVYTAFDMVRQEWLFGQWNTRPEASGCVTEYAYNLACRPVEVRGTCAVTVKPVDTPPLPE